MSLQHFIFSLISNVALRDYWEEDNDSIFMYAIVFSFFSYLREKKKITNVVSAVLYNKKT